MAYHPAMPLALLIYDYVSDTFSSRKMERATYDSVAFRFIASNYYPDPFLQNLLSGIMGLVLTNIGVGSCDEAGQAGTDFPG